MARSTFRARIVPEQSKRANCEFASIIAGMTGVKALSAFPLALAATLLGAPIGQSQTQALRLQIVVDQSCLILAESDSSVVGDHDDAFRDDTLCHLESLLSSHHIEEKITDGERSRFFVQVAEQEYILQNTTDKPAVFLVRHHVPENWIVDSDPQPSSMDGSTALFQVNAEAGQRVRLHVGRRRSVSISPN